MYNEIDLHLMDSKIALEYFKKKYNEAIKNKDSREICVIHGYGSKKFESEPIIAKTLRSFLSKNKDKLEYRLDLNPGVTFVKPKQRLL